MDTAASAASNPPPAPPAWATRGTRRGAVWSGRALVLVGLIFLVLQLSLLPRPFGLFTDEATYLAMVDPRVPELYWTAPRAWGMPVLAAPVAVPSAGLPVIRMYFALLSTLGLVAAFWPWLRILAPPVAPLAALMFSTTWVTVFLGSLVMPNLYVALGSAAALGWFLRAAARPGGGGLERAGSRPDWSLSSARPTVCWCSGWRFSAPWWCRGSEEERALTDPNLRRARGALHIDPAKHA